MLTNLFLFRENRWIDGNPIPELQWLKVSYPPIDELSKHLCVGLSAVGETCIISTRDCDIKTRYSLCKVKGTFLEFILKLAMA